jgi:hypothetical protein
MIAVMQKEEVTTISAQEKWAVADHMTREKMLSLIGWSSSFATSSWKKLPHMVKVNLSNKIWTK